MKLTRDIHSLSNSNATRRSSSPIEEELAAVVLTVNGKAELVVKKR